MAAGVPAVPAPRCTDVHGRADSSRPSSRGPRGRRRIDRACCPAGPSVDFPRTSGRLRPLPRTAEPIDDGEVRKARGGPRSAPGSVGVPAAGLAGRTLQSAPVLLPPRGVARRHAAVALVHPHGTVHREHRAQCFHPPRRRPGHGSPVALRARGEGDRPGAGRSRPRGRTVQAVLRQGGPARTTGRRREVAVGGSDGRGRAPGAFPLLAVIGSSPGG